MYAWHVNLSVKPEKVPLLFFLVPVYYFFPYVAFPDKCNNKILTVLFMPSYYLYALV